MLSFGCNFFFFFFTTDVWVGRNYFAAISRHILKTYKNQRLSNDSNPSIAQSLQSDDFPRGGFFKAPDSYIIGCTSKYTKKMQSYQWWADNFVFNPWPKIGTHVIQSETFFTWCLSKLFLRHLFAWSRFMTTSFPISSLSLILIDTVITLFVTKLSHQGIKNLKYNK